MPDDDQIGPGFSRGTFDFRNGIAKVHAKLRCQPHGGKSLMAFVEDRPEIGLLGDQRAGIRALRQRARQEHPLLLSAGFMCVCGIVMFDLVRTMWGWQETSSFNGPVLDMISGFFQ